MLDAERQVIGEELNDTASGRAHVKCVNGGYGAGKSFLSRLANVMATDRGFVVSFVTVSVDTPLNNLEVVYRQLASSLSVIGHQAALKGLVDRWVYRIEDEPMEVEGLSEDDPALRARTQQEIEQALARIAGLPGAFVQVLDGYNCVILAPTAGGNGEQHEDRGFRPLWPRFSPGIAIRRLRAG